MHNHRCGKYKVMSTKDIISKAMLLKPEERYVVVEEILKSLDNPDPQLEEIWAEEAEKRLEAYRNGRLSGVSFDEIFNESE